MRSLAYWVFGAALVAGTLVPVYAGGQLTDAPIHHASGQSITPSFEGWFKNPDGSISLSFGYLNRNYTEEVTNGNTPQIVKFDASGKSAQGPRGIQTEMKVTTPAPVELTVMVTDDGI